MLPEWQGQYAVSPLAQRQRRWANGATAYWWHDHHDGWSIPGVVSPWLKYPGRQPRSAFVCQAIGMLFQYFNQSGWFLQPSGRPLSAFTCCPDWRFPNHFCICRLADFPQGALRFTGLVARVFERVSRMMRGRYRCDIAFRRFTLKSLALIWSSCFELYTSLDFDYTGYLSIQHGHFVFQVFWWHQTCFYLESSAKSINDIDVILCNGEKTLAPLDL